MDTPRTITIHPSLTRPLLLAGAERLPMGVLWITIVALVVCFRFDPLALGLAALLATAGQWCLVQLAKDDPQLFAVAQRHMTYQVFYVAQSRVHAPIPPPRPAVPY